ncbi:MAG: hypothetical protein LUE99_11200 [Bacteroides sp.]|nr:hypothetical protein [Bacteroides sp.]
MNALDYNMLSVIRTMKKQTNSQKLKELGTPDKWRSYAVLDNFLLFMSALPDSDKLKCEHVVSLDDIFSLSYLNGFLVVVHKDCYLYILDFNSHMLWI